MASSRLPVGPARRDSHVYDFSVDREGFQERQLSPSVESETSLKRTSLFVADLVKSAGEEAPRIPGFSSVLGGKIGDPRHPGLPWNYFHALFMENFSQLISTA